MPINEVNQRKIDNLHSLNSSYSNKSFILISSGAKGYGLPSINIYFKYAVAQC